MKSLSFVVSFLIITLLSGCDLVAGIFKAGAYTGVFVVLVLIALIIYVVSKFKGKG